MARTKGTKNKHSEVLPHYSTLPQKERINFLANLIIDRITADQKNGQVLFKQLSGQTTCKNSTQLKML